MKFRKAQAIIVDLKSKCEWLKNLTFMQGLRDFQKSNSHLKILGVRRVKRSKFHTEDPQILGATVQNVVGGDELAPGSFHP